MRSHKRMFVAAWTITVALGAAACADDAPTAIAPEVSERWVSANSKRSATLDVGDTVSVSTFLKGGTDKSVLDPKILKQISNSSFVGVAPGETYVVFEGKVKRNMGQKDSVLVTVRGDATVPPSDDEDSQATDPGTEPAPSEPAPTEPTPTEPEPEPTAPSVRVGYYVAPNGSSSGKGTIDSPLSFAAALDGAGGKIGPGDTVWVRGGTYKGTFYNKLKGTASSPVVVRQLPGERATIDGTINVQGQYTTFWGLEVMQSSPSYHGLNVRAPGTRLVNLVVHDAGRNGIGFWSEAPDSEIHGSIIYNNGAMGNPSHGLYTQNRTGIKHITDNVLFNNEGYGLHAYGESGQYLQNFVIDGNASFNNGLIGGSARNNILVGGNGAAATGIVVTNNTLYFSQSVSQANMRLGYKDTKNGTLTVRDNFIVGGQPALEIRSWSSVSNSGNQLFNGTTKPSGLRVVVRPNKYEKGRANVIVSNPGRQGSVSADLSGVLRSGDRYEVRSVQRIFGAPVASGTYSGGSISIPMGSIQAPKPLGLSATPPTTGPEFDVFVVTRVTN